jgi:hypothetical protein
VTGPPDAAVSIRRLVNTSIYDTAKRLDGAGDTRFDFVCECGDLRCTRIVTLTLAEYEQRRPGTVVEH